MNFKKIILAIFFVVFGIIAFQYIDNNQVYAAAVGDHVVVDKTVSAKSSTGYTATGLLSGAEYKIVVKGTFTLSSNLHYDSQWSDNGGPANCYCHQASSFKIGGSALRATNATESAAKTAHEYTFYKTVTGTSLNFKVTDSNYPDNTGSLTVNMFLNKLPGDNTGGATLLSLDLFLHGIGKAGDSIKEGEAGGGNPDPERTERDITVSIYDSQNQVTTKTGKVTFDSTSGSFKGNVDLGTSFVTGSYLVKVKFSQSLPTQIGQFQTITNGRTTALPKTYLVTGDVNDDGAISLNVFDFNTLLACINKESCDDTQKLQSDLDDNGKVDPFDFNLFLREIANRSE